MRLVPTVRRTRSGPDRRWAIALPATLDKACLELNAASHSAPTSPNVTIAKYSISWLKRFVDDDTRYEQFLCPAPSGSAIEEYRDTCPHS